MSESRSPEPTGAAAVVTLQAADLPAFCPNRKMPVWSNHPKVYLDVVHTGRALCPYCSTEYRLDPDARVTGH